MYHHGGRTPQNYRGLGADLRTYTVLFVAALPLAPLLALINAYAQIRVDAWNIFQNYYLRPFSELEDIGSWADIIELLSYIAVFTNSILQHRRGEFLTHPDLTNPIITLALVAPRYGRRETIGGFGHRGRAGRRPNTNRPAGVRREEAHLLRRPTIKWKCGVAEDGAGRDDFRQGRLRRVSGLSRLRELWEGAEAGISSMRSRNKVARTAWGRRVPDPRS